MPTVAPTESPTELSAHCEPVKFGAKVPAGTNGVFFSPQFPDGEHLTAGQTVPGGKGDTAWRTQKMAGQLCECDGCVAAFKAADGCRLWANSILEAHTVTENSKVFSVIPAGCHKCDAEAARECGINGLGYEAKAPRPSNKPELVKQHQMGESVHTLANTEGKHEPKGKGEGDSATHEIRQASSSLAGPKVHYDPKVAPVAIKPEVEPVKGQIYHGPRKYFKSTLGKVEAATPYTEGALEPKGHGATEGDMTENGEERADKGREASVVYNPMVDPVKH
jgi:hypothetical protein